MTALPPPMPAPKPPRVRNQRTQAKMRRDVIWQMAVPLGLVVAAALTLAVLVVLPGGAGVRSPWADVALIFLSLPTIVAGLVALVVVAALVAGMVYVLRELPPLFKLVQDFMAVASYRVQTGADKVAGVFLSIRAVAAGAQRAAQDVRRAVKRGG